MLKTTVEIFLFSLVFIIPIYTNNEDSSVYFTGALTVLLVLYYLIFRKGFSWKYDQPLLIILIGFTLTDSVNIYSCITKESISILYFIPLIYQFGIIYAFRQEGSRVVFDNFFDYAKVGIPSIIFFTLFGYYVLDHPNLFEYISMFVSSMLITLLIVLSFFRPAELLNYIIGFLGACALGVTGTLYFFLDINTIENSYFPFMNGLYLLTEFLLVKAILDNLNKRVINN